MIKFKNVSKTYKSKNKHEKSALDDISFTLPSRGLVSILGKSGSGKSTLLNLIGGIDYQTSGEIIFLGKSCKDFTSKDYDNYRNNVVGFVFQDYNLIENLSIYDNLLLALKLQNQNNNELINEVLNIVQLPEEYKTRYPNELSGGEQQRVAIARALVKDSKVILADEPTGNLDSETGETIFSLLKEISKDKLVIVVTHDKEYAERYSDYLLNLKDGKIVRVIDILEEVQNTNINFNNGNYHLPTKYALKLSFDSLLNKKAKTILTLLICLITILTLSISYVFTTFSSTEAIALTIKKNNVSNLLFYQSEIDIPSGYSENYKINQNLLKILNEKYSNIAYIKIVGTGEYKEIIINNKENVLNMGYSFIGNSFEVDDNSVYVTDYFIEEAYYYMDILVDNQYVSLDKDKYPYETIIGKTLRRDAGYDHIYYNIAGIIKTNYQDYYDDFLNPIYKNDKLYSSESFYYKHFLFTPFTYFCKAEYSTLNLLSFNHQSIIINFDNSSSSLSSLDNNFRFAEINSENNNSYKILTNDGVITKDDINLNDNEVIVSLDFYNLIFNESKTSNYYLGQNDFFTPIIIKNYPIYLQEKINFNLMQTQINEKLIDFSNLKIIGVAMNYSYGGQNSNSDYTIILSSNNIQIMKDLHYLDYTSIVVNSSNLDSKTIVDLINDSRKDKLFVNFGYASPIYENEQAFRNLGFSFALLGILLAIINVLLIISLISFSIMNQKKTIGIIRALGGSKKDVQKIYLYESFIISLIIWISSSILIVFGISFVNVKMGENTIPNIVFLNTNFLTFVIIFVSTIVLINFSTLIPLRKVMNMKLTDAVKE